MNTNKDRIWDVLIEDALHDSGAGTEPNRRGEHTRRLLQPVGPLGIDRGRSMRYTRHRWTKVVAGVLALLIVAAILYAGVAVLPKLSEANPTEQPKAAEETSQSPSNKQRGDETPETNQTPEPQPTPDDSSEPAPDPEPDHTGGQPKPEPKPDDSVEQPKPEPKPDDTIEQPRPEPKPDDTVEQPKEPEGTTPEPAAKPGIRLLSRDGLDVDDLQVSADRKTWGSTKYLSEFASGSWFRAKSAFDLETGGVLLRLKGEARVEVDAGTLSLTLGDDDLFIDNRGANQPVSIRIESHVLILTSGAVMLTKRASSDDVYVYDGEITVDDSVVTPGQRCTLRKSGFSKAMPLRKSMKEEAFLQSLPERVSYRETFDSPEPNGRLREGEIESGVLRGSSVFWGYPENIQYETGLMLRLRVRFTGAESATLTQFAVPREDNFSFELEAMKSGEWYVLEVPVEKFLERTSHKDHPNELDWFQNVSITAKGKDAQVELDWVELIRAVR